MAHSITTVKNNTCLQTLSIEAQHGLRLEEEAWALEPLKEELCSLLPVCEGVQRCLSKEYWMIFRRNFQEIENMPPQKLHVRHVHNDAVFHWVTQLKSAFVLILEC